MRTFFLASIIFTGMIVVSCKNKSTEPGTNNTDFVEITKAQFQSENMEFGEPKQRPFSESIPFTGTVSPSETGSAQVSLPVSGIIENILCVPGQFVKKGQTIFEISGNEFIDLQKDIAESSATLKRLKIDYERVTELFNENIATKKDFILSESTYKTENAKYNALKIKLEKIGLNVTKIEDGFFYSSYFLEAPIKGYITSIDATIGQYIEQQLNVAEITDAQLFELRLSIFENEIDIMHPGQEVEFYVAGNTDKIHKAKLSFVGRVINDETKAITCYAEIEDLKSFFFVSNQFAEGRIIVDTSSVYSLPETAVLKSENESFILNLEEETEESYFFSKIKVSIGRKNKNYFELLEKPKINKLIVKGVYNIEIK